MDTEQEIPTDEAVLFTRMMWEVEHICYFSADNYKEDFLNILDVIYRYKKLIAPDPEPKKCECCGQVVKH